MNLVEYAKDELARITDDGDEIQEQINDDILEIIEVFQRQGHSGTTGAYTIRLVSRLLGFKPLTPITGEDSEWNEITDKLEQNRRVSSVFRKNKDNSTAYDIDARIFSDDGGKTWFSRSGSSKPIEFPYMPPESPEKVLEE